MVLLDVEQSVPILHVVSHSEQAQTRAYQFLRAGQLCKTYEQRFIRTLRALLIPEAVEALSTS